MIKKELLKELIIQGQSRETGHLREREVTIPLDSDKIVVVTGIRRAGKTSALYLTMDRVRNQGIAREKILFLNFDDERLPFEPHEFDLILQAYRELNPEIPMNEVYLFFDEIQVSPGWEQFVRRIYEQETTKVFITGSNAKLLSQEIASTLRGRTLTYELFPLSFREYCQFHDQDTGLYDPLKKAQIIRLLQKYLHAGGFPELIRHNDPIRDQILQEYYHVMLYRDLVERYEISNLPGLKYFIRRIFTNLTKPTSINRIFNELKSAGIQVGKNTLYEWIDYLQAIYLFNGLQKWDPSQVKGNLMEKKYYCIDNGLLRTLSFNPGRNHGILLENLIYWWLRRSISTKRELFYYKGKQECDFVVNQNQKTIQLIQACWDIDDQNTLNREIKGLLEASEQLNCNKLLIITYDQEHEVHHDHKTIQIKPAWRIWV